MHAEGVDALLASSVNNVYYFTGYYAFEGGYAGNEIGALEAPFSLKSSGKDSVLILGAFDEGFYEGKSRCIYYGKSVGDPKEKIFTDLTPVDAVVKAISESEVKGKVAVDPMFPLAVARQLGKRLPKIELVSDTKIFQSLRMIKTDEEVSRMRRAVEIVEYGNKVAYESLRTGMTEIGMVNEARVAVLEHYKSEAAHLEFGHMEVGNGVRSGRGAGTYPTDYPLKKGDIVHLDAGLRYKHYVGDTCRDAVFQKASPEVVETHRVITAVQEKTLQALKPGITTAEVYQIALGEIKRLGWKKFDSEMFGHSLGLSFHENPLITPTSNIRLEPNMVINVEIPVSPIKIGAFNMEDTSVVTKSGSERLSRLPHDLYVLGNH
jgi:Xaa-Pro aminopeptidase